MMLFGRKSLTVSLKNISARNLHCCSYNLMGKIFKKTLIDLIVSIFTNLQNGQFNVSLSHRSAVRLAEELLLRHLDIFG